MRVPGTTSGGRGWLDATFQATTARAWPAALAALALVLSSAWCLPRVSYEFSLEDLFPRGSPQARFHARAAEIFGRDDGTVILGFEGDPFHPRVARIEARLAAVAGVEWSTSPASLHTLASPSPGLLEARPLRPDDDDPLARATLVSEDGLSGAILLGIAERENHHAGREPIVSGIERVLDEEGGRWHLGGVPVIRVAYVRQLQSDLNRLLPLAMLVSLAFLANALRDWRHVLACSATIALGTAASASLLVLSGTPFTVFTPAALAVVLVVGTSDLVHLVQRFAELTARPSEHRLPLREAVAEAVRRVGPACLATSGTTALGFMSLLVTSIPNIRRFGAFTAAGVMLMFGLTFIVMPPLLILLGPPRAAAARGARRGQRRMRRLGRSLASRPWLGPALALLVVAAGLAGAQRLRVDPRILGDVQHSEIATANAFLEQQLGAVLPLDLHIFSPEGDLRSPEALAAMARLESWLRQREMVGQVLGPTDLISHAWRALGERGLPPTTDAAAQALLLYDLVDPEITARFVAGPGHVRVRARVRDRGHQSTVRLVSELEEQAASLLHPLGAELQVSGVAWLAQEINRTLTRQFGGSFLLALVLVALLGAGVLRRLRLVGLALAPNLLPLLALLGLMGWSGLVLGPASAMVFSVAFGLAVDDTIHFLASYRRLRARGHGAESAVVSTTGSIGRSLVDTSLLLAAGFAVFSVSEYGAMASFGLLTAFCVIAAVIADLAVLGPLLVLFDHDAGAGCEKNPAEP